MRCSHRAHIGQSMMAETEDVRRRATRCRTVAGASGGRSCTNMSRPASGSACSTHLAHRARPSAAFGLLTKLGVIWTLRLLATTSAQLSLIICADGVCHLEPSFLATHECGVIPGMSLDEFLIGRRDGDEVLDGRPHAGQAHQIPCGACADEEAIGPEAQAIAV